MTSSETTLNWYQHNFDPFALTLGGVSLPWYWLNYVLGWFWCDFIGRKWILSLPDTENREQTLIAFRYFMLLGWILMLVGARLGYITFYNLSYFSSHPDQLAAIWNGGMSFHGGLLGVALAALVISRIYKISLFAMTDPIALGITPIIFLGRIANFLNGELPGRLSDVPWAVIFPSPFNDGPRHPSQLYEAFGEGFVVGIILLWFRNSLKQRTGLMTLSFIALYSGARFVIEFFRQPDPQIGMIIGLTLGQWFSVAFLALTSSLALRMRVFTKPVSTNDV
jgi:phosphatidylglycerol---prolipoprotein diacylglyceryl transferase